MHVITIALYSALVLLQCASIIMWFAQSTDLHFLIIIFLSVFIGITPLVGTFFGITGATIAWELIWWQSGLLFLGGFMVVIMFALLTILTERF